MTNLIVQMVWYGGYKPELWQQCLKACEDFFDMLAQKGHYELFQPTGTTCDDYRAAFNTAYFTRNNTELLISTRIIGKYNWDWWYYWGDWVPNGGYTPTLEYMEMFPMSDGTPFDFDKAVAENNMFFEDNDYNKPTRDPRLYETILVNGAKWSGRSVELWAGGRENANSTTTETGQYATGFAGAYIADKTGSIYGTGEMHNDPQLAPTSKEDVAALSSDEGGSGGEDPEPTPGDAIYFETFGSADASDKPLISTYTGWTKSGSGADEVTYTSTGNVSIRNSGKLSAGYDGASGENKCFLGTNNPAFMINKIKTGGAQKLQLTFGGSYSKNTNGEYDNTFYTDKFHVSLSADGTAWVPVEYTIEQADQYWVFATSDFTLKNAATYLYVKFAADETSVFAIDDVRVAAGEGGTEIDLGEGGEEPEPTPGAAITVNELYQLAEQATGTEKIVIDAENNRTLEAVVVTDAAGGNYTYNNLMVMAEGATQPKNGIMHMAGSRGDRQRNAQTRRTDLGGRPCRLSGHACHRQERNLARLGRQLGRRHHDVQGRFERSDRLCEDYGSSFLRQTVSRFHDG